MRFQVNSMTLIQFYDSNSAAHFAPTGLEAVPEDAALQTRSCDAPRASSVPTAPAGSPARSPGSLTSCEPPPAPGPSPAPPCPAPGAAGLSSPPSLPSAACSPPPSPPACPQPPAGWLLPGCSAPGPAGPSPAAGQRGNTEAPMGTGRCQGTEPGRARSREKSQRPKLCSSPTFRISSISCSLCFSRPCRRALSPSSSASRPFSSLQRSCSFRSDRSSSCSSTSYLSRILLILTGGKDGQPGSARRCRDRPQAPSRCGRDPDTAARGGSAPREIRGWFLKREVSFVPIGCTNAAGTHRGSVWRSPEGHAGLRGRGPAPGEQGLAGSLLPTCSPLPSRTPPWQRTCRPPGAGSPARSLCPSPSSPPPAAPAPGRAARLPGDRDGKRCLGPSWVAPLQKSSPRRYLLLHVVRLPGLFLDLQPVLQHLHFCLQRDKEAMAQPWRLQHPTPAGSRAGMGTGLSSASTVTAATRWGLACSHPNPVPRGEGKTRPDAASPAAPSPWCTPPSVPWRRPSCSPPAAAAAPPPPLSACPHTERSSRRPRRLSLAAPPRAAPLDHQPSSHRPSPRETGPTAPALAAAQGLLLALSPGRLLAEPLLLLGHLGVEPAPLLLQRLLLLLQLLLAPAGTAASGTCPALGTRLPLHPNPSHPFCRGLDAGGCPWFTGFSPPRADGEKRGCSSWVLTAGNTSNAAARGCRSVSPTPRPSPATRGRTAAGPAPSPAGSAPPSPAPAAPAAPLPAGRSAGQPARPTAAARPRAASSASGCPACAWR